MTDETPRSSPWHIQTWVRANGREFHVVTHNRLCSSPAAPDHEYAETLVWEGDRLVGQVSDYKGWIRAHQRTIEILYAKGELKEGDDE